MLPRSAYLVVPLFLAAAGVQAANHKAPPAKPAAQYATFDTHPNEHVTIAAEPCDDPKDCAFFRLPYIQHGFVPIRVIITNDGDRALSLDDARIQFIPATGTDRVPAATEDEINRRLFTLHSTQPIRIPLVPIPIPRKPIDKKITEDQLDFSFKDTVVNPHATVSAFLFYDVKQFDEPALRHAELYIKRIRTLDGKDELFSFTIPFDKWLAAKPPAQTTITRGHNP